MLVGTIIFILICIIGYLIHVNNQNAEITSEVMNLWSKNWKFRMLYYTDEFGHEHELMQFRKTDADHWMKFDEAVVKQNTIDSLKKVDNGYVEKD